MLQSWLKKYATKNTFTNNVFTLISYVHKYQFVKLTNQCRHSVDICKFFLHDSLQKFRQINFFTKELYCKSIWRKKFALGDRKISEIATLCVTKEKFRQINSLVFSIVKTLLSRNFCQRSVSVNFNFCNFHTVLWKPKLWPISAETIV